MRSSTPSIDEEGGRGGLRVLEGDDAAREKGGRRKRERRNGMNPVLQGDERRENAMEREEGRTTREEEREKRRHSCRHVSSLSFSNKGAVPPGRPVAVNRETKIFRRT